MTLSARLRASLIESSYATTAAVLLVVLSVVAISRSPSLTSVTGLNGALGSATPLLLATLAITATALVGSGVDLSIGPAMIFVNVVLVRYLFGNGIGDQVSTIAAAIGIGVAVQLVIVAAILVIRIEPIIVTLGGFLTLSGLNLVVLPQPQGQVPPWLSSWGAATAGVGPMAIVCLVVIAAWILLTRTPFFRDLRLVGADDRTAYVSGLPVTVLRIGGHVIAGVLIGMAGLAYTGLIASGNPSQGPTYTLIAVTALVLGGTSLAGGRGGALGSVLGALAVSMVSITLTTFDFGIYSSFVVQLAYGLILVAALLVGTTIPALVRNRTRGALT
jgi:ribose transport system permease protein